MKLPKLPRIDIYLSEYQQIKKDPRKKQLQLLRAILKENRNTVYGREHGFSEIDTYEDFIARVPVIEYEDIRSYVDRMTHGERRVLVRSKVQFFATTSGTTAAPKLIPVTNERMRQLRKELVLWMNHILREYPLIVTGKLLYFAGPYEEGRTKAGIRKGSISGYMAKKTPIFARNRLVLSPEIYNELDFDRKMHMIAMKALRSRITQMGFAAPVEGIQFFEYLQNNREFLIVEMVKRHPLIAKQLALLDDFTPASLWPELRLISTLMGETQQPYLKRIRELVGDEVVIRDPGIYASEGRLTLGITKEPRDGIVVAQENFFEFCRETAPGEFAEPVLIDQLKLGERYKVILTTNEGLYRYDMGDVIEVRGFQEKLPVVRFATRSRFINLVGELASEEALVHVVRKVVDEQNLEVQGYAFIPRADGQKRPYYELVIEADIDQAVAQSFEDALQSSIQDYGQMRNEFGRLAALQVTVLTSGSFAAYERQRRGQPKPRIIADDAFLNQFKIKTQFSTE